MEYYVGTIQNSSQLNKAYAICVLFVNWKIIISVIFLCFRQNLFPILVVFPCSTTKNTGIVEPTHWLIVTVVVQDIHADIILGGSHRDNVSVFVH